eukprot:COSAG06_NODE_4344_length_4352_cov_2.634611_3_plen_161_part_00
MELKRWHPPGSSCSTYCARGAHFWCRWNTCGGERIVLSVRAQENTCNACMTGVSLCLTFPRADPSPACGHRAVAPKAFGGCRRQVVLRPPPNPPSSDQQPPPQHALRPPPPPPPPPPTATAAAAATTTAAEASFDRVRPPWRQRWSVPISNIWRHFQTQR